MGLLDDAIREHLELKRRHGADPDEVSRQEREALGAPVRGEFAKPAGEAGATPAGPTRRRSRPSRRGRHRGRRRPGDRRAARDAGRARAGAREPRGRRAGARAGHGGGPVAGRGPRRSRAGPTPSPSPSPRPSRSGPPRAPREPRRPRARTCSRRRPSSSRRRRSTSACGSSRSLRATSTGTSSPPGPLTDLRPGALERRAGSADPTASAQPPFTPGRGCRTPGGDGSPAPEPFPAFLRHGSLDAGRAVAAARPVSRALSIGDGTAPALPPAVALDRRRGGDDHAQGGAPGR